MTEADLDAINGVIKKKLADRNSPTRRRSSTDSPMTSEVTSEEKTAELTPPRPARRVNFGAADENVLSPRYAEC